ncbi:thiaminase (transcriptional activator TenA) [Halogranum amylolyticum]|uniref:Thiaminase (Transcriptional activator TenA) n=1 Tax=Halogranum amylolyticum TaxID=660520 RepID=A0A1H8T8D6_9EURY|nr:thiaminase II [Halogranum amylolyticum]SEO87449.1 thiaminase (transcriptional activator TenA) [Halogranum amylolyticum]
MAFTDSLRDDADEIWTAIYDHPMVEGIGDGTLDEERFRYWLRQDYVYLVDYCRLFALGAAQAPTLDRMETFATLLSETLHTEMELHREYAADFGITETDLEETAASPTTRGYTDFLVRTAALGTFGDLVAALLPCMWGFNDTGLRLREDGLPDEERYAEWVRTYSSDEFTELTEWCKELMDDVAASSTPEDRERYRELFLTSARYEYEFWDAAWQLEGWSV